MDITFSRIGGLQGPEGAAHTNPKPADAAAFAGELSRAVGEVDKLQMEADHQASLVAQGGGNIHEMALSLEKADIALRMAVKVRNKVVDTYNEIMRMGV